MAAVTIPDGSDRCWNLDFVAEALSWGQRLCILCIVDDFTPYALRPGSGGGHPDRRLPLGA